MQQAQLVDGLCQRWGQLPSAVLNEPADEVLHMLAILQAAGLLGGAEEKADEDDDMEQTLAGVSEIG